MKEERLIFRERIVDRKKTDYLTHAFFPYPARFIPQIPKYFIREFMQNSYSLLDPFAGSGTSLVEALISGYNSYGIEINPLGKLLSETKTTPLDKDKLGKEFARIKELIEGDIAPFSPEMPNKDFWFEPSIQNKLGKIKSAIDTVRDENIRKFFLMCLASIIRKCSNADPSISKPVFTKHMKEVVKTRKVDVYKLFQDKVDSYSERIIALSLFLDTSKVEAKIIGDDSRKINLPDKSVHLIITSPPFINAQEYFRTTKFEILWTGLATSEKIRELESKMIGIERIVDTDVSKLWLLDGKKASCINKVIKKIHKVDNSRAYIMYQYFKDMKTVFRELHRVLDDTGRFAITIGDNTIRKIPINTHDLIRQLAESVGFKTEKVAYDIIKTRRLSIKRNETAGLMLKEWALVFKK